MESTRHSIYEGDARHMSRIPDGSVDLIVTSPPYPMIQMWDNTFGNMDRNIPILLDENGPKGAFRLMHAELDKVWKECHRVLKDGRFMCINIGNATRTVHNRFAMYDNVAEIVHESCDWLGFTQFPPVIWRKPSNSPNRFLGSGMLPCGAYVTLEHEYILIFRKGSRRTFATREEMDNRLRSAIFFEERNAWYSDLWEINGVRQAMSQPSSRERSAAFPIEIPYRLISMFSVIGDTVLDPFSGTGTTSVAAMMTGRNSIGYEIDPLLAESSRDILSGQDTESLNARIRKRVSDHAAAVSETLSRGKEMKYMNGIIGTPVMTAQEEKISVCPISGITRCSDGTVTADYGDRITI